MVINFIDYFKQQIKYYIPAGISYHVGEEFTYDEETDVEFVIKQLTGSIANGLTQIPYQLMCNVSNSVAHEIKNALDTFALEHNEELVSFNDQKFKTFYDTSVVVGTFKNRGLIDTTSISISINIIEYSVPLDILTIKRTYKSVKKEISFVAVSFAYITSTESTGGIGTGGELHNFAKNKTIRWTIQQVIKATDKTLLLDIMKATVGNNKVALEITMSDGEVINYNNMIVTEASVPKDYNGLALLTINLAVGV